MKVSHYGFLIGKTAFSQRKIIEIKAKLIYNKAMWNNFNKTIYKRNCNFKRIIIKTLWYILIDSLWSHLEPKPIPQGDKEFVILVKDFLLNIIMKSVFLIDYRVETQYALTLYDQVPPPPLHTAWTPDPEQRISHFRQS